MSLGIDPALYGALAVFCSIIGEVTPPMGPQLWIAAPTLQGENRQHHARGLGLSRRAGTGLILVTFFPQISLFLVHFVR